ncbi:hypothetical protein NW762_013470 [Fusarium torreyae]|uniref:Ipa protein n=1 Tax=Fusarium torreyae TaxID=1237075 RepID=A0A9W8RLU9_9HYPO|nr:hypothetical protein NW762_013470 [Fusarium torreyae]
MNQITNSFVIRELYADVARRYRSHGDVIESTWRTFDVCQRRKCFIAGADNGVVLEHSLTTPLGEGYVFFLEWNLADIVEGEPNVLLDMLKHRATKTLYEQYHEGVNGTAGDYEVISQIVQDNISSCTNAYKNCYTFFRKDEQLYGHSFKVNPHNVAYTAKLRTAVENGDCIPQHVGELVLKRQLTLLQCLKILMDNILEEANSKEQWQVSKPTFMEVVANVHDQQSSLEEYLVSLRTESKILYINVSVQFFRQLRPVYEEEGQPPTVPVEGNIGIAVFEVMHQATQAVAIWMIIRDLLDLLLERTLDKRHAATILQELSNICYFEYTRTKAALKQHLSAGIGAEWFKPLPGLYDRAGYERLALNGDPEELTRKDPQLHYLLRLCQPETDVVGAVKWIEKLEQLYASHSLVRKKLFERENRAYFDMAAIVTFVQDISSVFLLPPPSWGKGRLLVTGLLDTEAELNQCKKGIDLGELVYYPAMLMQSDNAIRTLQALERYVEVMTKTTMGCLYEKQQDVLIHDLEGHYQKAKVKREQDVEGVFVPMQTAPPDQEWRVASPREKEKRRSSHGSVFSISSPDVDEPPPPAEIMKVSPATAKVFNTLFDKSQSQGTLSWTAFEASMVELGFAVIPKFGSVYTFRPGEAISINRPINIHRPHGSKIEGSPLRMLGRRLARSYGWNESTFETL